MPVIIERGDEDQVKPEILVGRSWYYYQCEECLNQVKSDIPFETLHCIYCGKTMHRNCHQVVAW